MKVYLPPTHVDVYKERDLIARLEKLSPAKLYYVYCFMHWLLLKQKIETWMRAL